MANIPLDAFNGQLHYATAWGFDRADVIEFMEQVVNNLAHYGVNNRWRPFAGTIRNHIIRLKPDEVRQAGQPQPRQPSASYYPKPPQYLYRRTLENIPPPPPWPQIPPVRFRLDPRPVSDHQVFGMYDFLGFFLSLAPAPEGAKEDTFFAPWLVIYWKWSKLFQATDEEKQAATERDHSLRWRWFKDPSVLQCTWRKAKKPDEENPDAEEIIFHMGASVGGFAKKLGPKSVVYEKYGVSKYDWQQSIVHFRFNLLADPSGKVNNRYEWTEAPKYELSTNQKKNPRMYEEYLKTNAEFGWDFGNCGETYPFLEILKNASQTNKADYGGLAIRPDKMKKVFDRNPQGFETFQTPPISPPCRNCEYLLDAKYGIGTAKFNG